MGGYQGSACVALLKDAIDDETTSQSVNVQGRTNITFYVSGDGTTSSGVITLEESFPVGDPFTRDEPQPYAGTWGPITTVNASDVSGGAQKAIHISSASFGYVRARVSTVIGGGGSVSVGLVAV